MYRLAVLIASSVLLGACGFVHDERIDGPYRLVAVDVMSDMCVCYDLGDGYCIGRISATVSAVGFNEQYVVAARYPNRSEYYYIIRALDGPLVDPSVTVRGPFDAATFETESKRLGLPPVSAL